MANGQLKSVVDVFERRIYRIPDYQRGYAWEEKQLVDFWEDLRNVSTGRIHYTGVLTLEKVENRVWKKWEDDQWLIDGKGFAPYFIVDGQQRLTTVIILLKVIVDRLKKGEKLNYDSKEEISTKYLFQSKDQGISKSYIFGYEKDNPSYEFLKTRIFDEQSSTNQNVETLYTANLENAKVFFSDIVAKSAKTTGQLEDLYKRLTLSLKFNVYEIDEDLDVFVAFETMNNRGKNLSQLELLKNRLIYLSTLLHVDDNEKSALRKNINEAWKTVYEYLGKNKKKPLDDDEFLKNHWIMFFKYSRDTANDYARFLLGERFVAKRALSGEMKISEIQEYISSIQESVKHWYYLFNPAKSDYPEEIKEWLEKLDRLGYGAFAPLIMAVLTRKKAPPERIAELLRAAERYIFVIFRISQRRSNTGDSEFYRFASSYYKGEQKVRECITLIDEWIKRYFSVSSFFEYVRERFELDPCDGYYAWNGIRYFLFEYDLFLKGRSKSHQSKIVWEEYEKYRKDFISVEHIYPQNDSKPCWQKNFAQFSTKRRYVRNSLGNLLPLSQQKNSSLQNDCFKDKKIQKSGSVGYFNGSYSENEVAQKEDWLPQDILDRGLRLLDFLENRWGVQLGEKDDKKRLLFLDFLQ